MNALRSYWIMFGKLLGALAYRRGWRKSLPDIHGPGYAAAIETSGHWLGWKRRLRIIGEPSWPDDIPVVFAGNHMGMTDPFHMGAAVFKSSQEQARPFFMMRHGFFSKVPRWLSWIVDCEDLLYIVRTRFINRDRVQLSDLKPFIKLLRDGQSFMIFPGRTRSRSGLIFEYRTDEDRAGSVSFFLAHSGKTGAASTALTRTYNPVTKENMIVLGQTQHRLDEKRSRESQAAVDRALMTEIASNVIVTAAHATAAVLYRSALRGDNALAEGACIGAVEDLLKGLDQSRTLAEERDNAAPAVRAALSYFEKTGAFAQNDGVIQLERDNILSVPDDLRAYATANPVKHLVNHLVHLPEITRAILAG